MQTSDSTVETSEGPAAAAGPATTVAGAPAAHGASRQPSARTSPPALLLAAAVLAVALAGCSPDPEASPEPEPGTPTSASQAATPEPMPSESVPAADEHSTVGGLPEGFPTALLPVPAGAEILVSTFAPRGQPGAGEPSDVSLNLRTDLPVADVAALYRASLTAAGFTETVGTPTEGLAAQSTYSRSAAAELVTVGILDQGDVRTVTVGGRVRTDG